MKVLLLKPCWSYPVDPGDSTYNRVWPPLALLNCASLLREKGHEVSVVDASAEIISPDSICEIASDFEIVFITSASLDRWQCPNLNIDPFIKTIYKLKKVCSRIFLMGTHGTVRTKEILEKTNVTAVIRGEPEATVVDLCSGNSLESIHGISYFQDGRIIDNQDRELEDLTKFPIPAYDLIKIENYRYVVLGKRFALLEASRGCPFNCIFCVKSMYGNQFRTKNTEQFISEIDYVIDEVKADTAYFIDLEFTVNRDLAMEVSRHLIKRGSPLSWCCQTRTDSVDPELLDIMRKAGCKIIHFGVETGAERIRGTLNKGITFEKVCSGMRMARIAGIQTVCFFMFGLPGETIQDMEETIRFAKQLNPTYASFHVALPYPGTEFYRQVESELAGEFFPKAYTGVVPYNVLERITRKAFRSFYLRPRYLAGRLKDGNLTAFWNQGKFLLSYLKHRLWS